MNITIIEDHIISGIGLEELLFENFREVKVFLLVHRDVFLTNDVLSSSGLIIMSLGVDDHVNVQTWNKISSLDTSIPIIICCTELSDNNLLRFLADRVSGLLFKSQEPQDFIKCVNAVLDGERYIASQVLEIVASQMAAFRKQKLKTLLNPRQLIVARLLANGKGTSFIARKLGLTMATIWIEKIWIFKNLAVKNILELREIVDSGYLL